MKSFQFVACLFVLTAVSAFGATPRYVATNGPGPAPYTSWLTAGSNIIEVVNYANTADAGDTVYISNGTYYLTNTVTINNTIVKGNSGDYRDVIVDGMDAKTCFQLTKANAFLANVTVSNGFTASGASAGGVLIGSTPSAPCPVVSNCLITSCSAVSGGGVAIYNSATAGAEIKNCVIEFNTAGGTGGLDGGGGVSFQAAGVKPLIQDCVVRFNYSKRNGGGICGWSGVIINSSIISNISCYQGGGVYLDKTVQSAVAAILVVSNSVISGNSSYYVGGIGIKEIANTVPAMLYNCLIAENSTTNGFGAALTCYCGTTMTFNCTYW